MAITIEAPSLCQRIPELTSRCLISSLHAASTTPGWNVISNNKVVDNVFGSIAIVKNGLLVKHTLGWESASFNYYVLQNKKLVHKYEIE